MSRVADAGLPPLFFSSASSSIALNPKSGLAVQHSGGVYGTAVALWPVMRQGGVHRARFAILAQVGKHQPPEDCTCSASIFPESGIQCACPKPVQPLCGRGGLRIGIVTNRYCAQDRTGEWASRTPEGWAWGGATGNLFHGAETPKHDAWSFHGMERGPSRRMERWDGQKPFSAGDIVELCLDLTRAHAGMGTLACYKNGEELGIMCVAADCTTVRIVFHPPHHLCCCFRVRNLRIRPGEDLGFRWMVDLHSEGDAVRIGAVDDDGDFDIDSWSNQALLRPPPAAIDHSAWQDGLDDGTSWVPSEQRMRLQLKAPV